VGEIAFRPARHTEVDYLIKVQVIGFADCFPSAGTKAPTKNQKLTNVFRLPAFLPTCMLYGAFCLSIASCSNNKCQNAAAYYCPKF